MNREGSFKSLGGVRNDITTLVTKHGCPHSCERLNGSRFCLDFYIIDAKMCLYGEAFNNDGLGHNKHMIKGRILLGWTFEVRVDQMTVIIFSILPTPPDRIYPSTRPIKFIATPPPRIQIIYDPFHFHSNYYIWFLTNQLDKPFLSNIAVSYLWPADVACAKWRKMVTWLTKDCWTVHLRTDSSKPMFLHNKAKLPDSFAVSFHFAINKWMNQSIIMYII